MRISHFVLLDIWTIRRSINRIVNRISEFFRRLNMQPPQPDSMCGRGIMCALAPFRAAAELQMIIRTAKNAFQHNHPNWQQVAFSRMVVYT